DFSESLRLAVQASDIANTTASRAAIMDLLWKYPPLIGFSKARSGVALLSFSGDEKLLAAAELDGGIEIFDVATRSSVGMAFQPRGISPSALAFSSNGNYVGAGYSDGLVSVVRRTDSSVMVQTSGSQVASALALSSATLKLAAGYLDGSVQLFDCSGAASLV